MVRQFTAQELRQLTPIQRQQIVQTEVVQQQFQREQQRLAEEAQLKAQEEYQKQLVAAEERQAIEESAYEAAKLAHLEGRAPEDVQRGLAPEIRPAFSKYYQQLWQVGYPGKGTYAAELVGEYVPETAVGEPVMEEQIVRIEPGKGVPPKGYVKVKLEPTTPTEIIKPLPTMEEISQMLSLGKRPYYTKEGMEWRDVVKEPRFVAPPPPEIARREVFRDIYGKIMEQKRIAEAKRPWTVSVEKPGALVKDIWIRGFKGFREYVARPAGKKALQVLGVTKEYVARPAGEMAIDITGRGFKGFREYVVRPSGEKALEALKIVPKYVPVTTGILRRGTIGFREYVVRPAGKKALELPPFQSIIGREIQAKKEKELRKRLAPLYKEFGVATTYEEQQAIIKKLKAAGVWVWIEEGKYQFYVPEAEKYRLRPGWMEKKVKEPVTGMFFRLLGEEAERTYGEIAERALYKGPTVRAKLLAGLGVLKGKPLPPPEIVGPRVVTQPEAKLIGKGARVGAEILALWIPGYAPVRFMGPTTETLVTRPQQFLKYAKEEPLEVGIAATYGIFRGVQYLRTPIRQKIIIGPRKVEAVQKMVKIKEKAVTIAKWKVREPGIKYIIQPRWQKLLKIFPKPEQIKYVKPRTYIFQAGGKIITKKGIFDLPPLKIEKGILHPEIIARARKGARYMDIMKLEGAGRVISKSEFATLSTLRKKSLKVMMKNVLKLKGNANKITDKTLYEYLRGQEISISEAYVEKIARLGQKIKAYEYGRRAFRAEAISAVRRKAGAWDIETEKGWAKFFGETPTKDITLPTKYPPKIPGKIIIKEKALVIGDVRYQPFSTRIEAGFIEPGKIKKTAIWKTFVETKPQIWKDIIKKKTSWEKTVKSLERPPKVTPAYVGGLGGPAAQSIYAGIRVPVPAVWEAPILIPGAVGTALVKTIPRVAAPPLPKIIDITKTLVVTKPALELIQKPIIKIIPKLEPKLVPKEVTKVVPKEITKLVPKEVTKVVPKVTPFEVLLPILIPKIIPKQIPKQIPKITPKITPKTALQIIPKITVLGVPPPPLFFLPPKIKRKKKIELRRKDIFIPEVRRKGIWMPLGAFKDPFVAITVGKKRVMETLGVSLRIRKAAGGLLPLVPSKFFRAAKKEAGVIVQKKRAAGLYRGRLTTKQERAEIQRLRRKKKGWWI